MALPASVTGTFNYTRHGGPMPEVFFYEPAAGTKIRDPGDDPHAMSVRNGWESPRGYELDVNGFSVEEFRPAHSDWNDDAAIRAHFYPEVVDLVKRTTGAKQVVVFDHTIRAARNEKQQTAETTTTQRAPVMLVHCDYTSNSGPTRVRQVMGGEAEDLLRRRVAFYNVWKPLHRKVEERPLAVCNAASAKADDFVTMALRYRERDGEIYVMSHSPSHDWVYFPEITPDQVIFLKTYESETDGRARFAGHSAFLDPTTRPGAPFRESVEIRTMAFF
jgi:hypothetical protein